MSPRSASRTENSFRREIKREEDPLPNSLPYAPPPYRSALPLCQTCAREGFLSCNQSLSSCNRLVRPDDIVLPELQPGRNWNECFMNLALASLAIPALFIFALIWPFHFLGRRELFDIFVIAASVGAVGFVIKRTDAFVELEVIGRTTAYGMKSVTIYIFKTACNNLKNVCAIASRQFPNANSVPSNAAPLIKYDLSRLETIQLELNNIINAARDFQS